MLERLPQHSGWIEVIAGGMFSGKTEALIHRLRRAKIARQRVQSFKPRIDERYSLEHIVSHSQLRLEAIIVDHAHEIPKLVEEETQVVGIDEGQFFANDLVEVCLGLAEQGKRVIVAGLDMDYRGIPFDPIPHLLAVAEYITKVQAICVRCGNPANFSQRLVAQGDRVVVGAEGTYEARCRACFRAHPVEKQEELPWKE